MITMAGMELERARSYEKEHEKLIADADRPSFHLSARTGWLNDPNGFSYYNDSYHMFYQYHPYSSVWGPMHWGHAVSRDLLHWTYLPAALAPDETYDRDGCFSGSAVTLPDGRHLLMYTGVRKEQQADGSFGDVQTQCLAVGDGVNYEKYATNPVLDEMDLPEGGSRYDFRDPKMWQQADGTYCCIAANRAPDGSGQILLYSSEDAFQWTFQKVLVRNQNRYGKMWECPDLFELDGKWVMLTSPMDMLPQGLEYHNGNGTLCLIGRLDEEQGTFVEERNQAIDYGIDFYAPQTILTPDGRRVMIGWMQNWDTCNLRTAQRAWFGQMSLPRELSIQNGRLYQKPIRELEELRANEVCYTGVTFTGDLTLEGVRGRRVDLELTIRSADEMAGYRKFAVRFAQDERYHTAISYRPYESVLKIDRKFSNSRRAIIHQRRSFAGQKDGAIRLRLILDRYSMEVFVNDGEQVLSATIYTEQTAEGISFFADGIVNMDVVKYDLLCEN